MKIVEKCLYKFSELSEAAKARACDDYARAVAEDFDAYTVIHDACDIGAMLGLDMRQARRQQVNGDFFYAPSIYHTDRGVVFDAEFSYSKGSTKAIRKEFPQAADLHDLADRLAAIQRRYFFTIRGEISADFFGGNFMSVSSYSSLREVSKSDEEDLQQIFSEFADWIFYRIRDEYEYQTSREAAEDFLAGNDEEQYDEEGRMI